MVVNVVVYILFIYLLPQLIEYTYIYIYIHFIFKASINANIMFGQEVAFPINC